MPYRTLKSKTMKKIILLALTALIMVGCDDVPKPINHIEGFNVVKIDSCEYIEQHTYAHQIYIHKGNCRFCKERRQKELKSIVEQLKEN